jgi:hypothetical protein
VDRDSERGGWPQRCCLNYLVVDRDSERGGWPQRCCLNYLVVDRDSERRAGAVRASLNYLVVDRDSERPGRNPWWVIAQAHARVCSEAPPAPHQRLMNACDSGRLTVVR